MSGQHCENYDVKRETLLESQRVIQNLLSFGFAI